MANSNLFSSLLAKIAPATNTVNEAGGRAYELTPKHALAQYAATGTFNTTFYASADEQLNRVLELAFSVDPEFVAKTAVFARTKGHMKDTPALLCAVLTGLGPEHLAKIFSRVIDDGKMLRNFVQMLRSGVTGRKSLGTMPKRLVRNWLASRTPEQIFRSSVGQSPSFGDVIKMVHPKPDSVERAALYGYLCGRNVDAAALPATVQQLEAYKAGKGELPEVPFQMLTALTLSTADWVKIARTATWQMTRMNLNTFARHGVFEVKGLTKIVAHRLANAELVRKARVFPYQLMMAYTAAGPNVPMEVREALQDAMEHALHNVPDLDGKVYVLPDVSGSMSSPVTGHRAGATSAVRCIDVAALFAAAMLRANPSAEVIPFAETVRQVRLNPRDSVQTSANVLARLGGGGTNCSAPLEWLNQRKAKGELVVLISDNESWVDQRHGRGTALMQEWEVFRARNKNAKLVCIDIQPNAHTQAQERADVLNIGGFSDQVFDAVAAFSKNELGPEHWVDVIERITL